MGLEKEEEAMKGAQVCNSSFLSVLACDLDGFISLMKVTHIYRRYLYAFIDHK